MGKMEELEKIYFTLIKESRRIPWLTDAAETAIEDYWEAKMEGVGEYGVYGMVLELLDRIMYFSRQEMILTNLDYFQKLLSGLKDIVEGLEGVGLVMSSEGEMRDMERVLEEAHGSIGKALQDFIGRMEEIREEIENQFPSPDPGSTYRPSM